MFKRRLCSHALFSLSLSASVSVCVCVRPRAPVCMPFCAVILPRSENAHLVGLCNIQGLTTDKMCSLLVINNYSFIKGLDYVVESSCCCVFFSVSMKKTCILVRVCVCVCVCVHACVIKHLRVYQCVYTYNYILRGGTAQWLERLSYDGLYFLLQYRLSVLALISVSVPSPCYRSSGTEKIRAILTKVKVAGYSKTCFCFVFVWQTTLY